MSARPVIHPDSTEAVSLAVAALAFDTPREVLTLAVLHRQLPAQLREGEPTVRPADVSHWLERGSPTSPPLRPTVTPS